MLEFERQQWDSGINRLAGVDEAGRGPLAGPVVAGAVVFNRDFAEREEKGLLKEITDSKKLSESRREAIFSLLEESPFIEIGIGVADSTEIDSINILRATHKAMARALESLGVIPDHVLVDGLDVSGLPCSSTAIVKGDAKSLSIAAASIVAKVTRDRHMREVDEQYPEYGFAGHKGYGTARHNKALLEFGPTPIHRRSFRPVREAENIKTKPSTGFISEYGEFNFD